MSSRTRTDQHLPASRPRGREMLRTVAEGTAGAVGDAFLRDLVRHLAEAFDAKLAFVAEAVRPGGARVRFLAGWLDGAPVEEAIEYDTDGQPCALLAEQAVLAVPEALTARFPADEAAVEMGLESYVASACGAPTARISATWRWRTAGRCGPTRRTSPRCGSSPRVPPRSSSAAVRTPRCKPRGAGSSTSRTTSAARFGRDLHDGAQQRLLGVSNLLRVARGRLADDAPRAGCSTWPRASSRRRTASCASWRGDCTPSR